MSNLKKIIQIVKEAHFMSEISLIDTKSKVLRKTENIFLFPSIKSNEKKN